MCASRLYRWLGFPLATQLAHTKELNGHRIHKYHAPCIRCPTPRMLSSQYHSEPHNWSKTSRGRPYEHAFYRT
ncbi:hypothetical protein F5146DRAFT_1026321 [Armillaria mellea]|nr:hypothetical protein F5146DRAFT_1026321 [Armillaria mellea]